MSRQSSLPVEMHNEVIRCYSESKMSAQEIARHFRISLSLVYRVLVSNDVPRRSPQEHSRLRFARKELSFHVLGEMSELDRQLFDIGVALYWGEGAKAESCDGIDFANSDPDMVGIFVAFLRRICGVDEARLRCSLYCYSNQDLHRITSFWSEITRVPVAQFTKPYVREDFRSEKQGRMPYGLIHVRYRDKKLLMKVKEWIKDIPKRFVGK